MIITYALLFLFSFLTLYYCYFIITVYRGLIKLEKSSQNLKPSNSFTKRVSVVIPFKNEAEIILKNLQSLKQVDYPKELLEIIYIDDNSDDNTADLIKQNSSDDYVKVLRLPNKQSTTASKKQALEYGIENSNGEIIVATDADCTYQRDWLKVLLSKFSEGIGFVAGPVDFECENNVLSKIQQLEHAGLILTGAGLIAANNPIICSGANVAFRKSVFTQLNGYSGYQNFASGDDSFLLTKFYYESDYGVDFCFQKDAMVLTRNNKNVNEFLNQRSRWSGKAFYYKNKRIVAHVILLTLFLGSIPIQLLMGSLFDNLFFILCVVSLLLKGIVDYLVLFKGTRNVFPKDTLKWFLVAEFIHIPYAIYSVLVGLFGKFNWRGRSLKT